MPDHRFPRGGGWRLAAGGCFVRYSSIAAARRAADSSSSTREPTASTMKDPTVRGLVHLIEETKSFGQKGFRKRLVVLEQAKGTFTNFVSFRQACVAQGV
jgi:hypothetical protein